MQRNVVIKKILKSTIFKPLTGINKLIPKKDTYVLLYTANMGISHNLKPLKEYLIANGYHKKYRIVCGVEGRKYFEKEKHVKYVSKLGALFTFLRSKHVFYTTGQIPIKPSKSQIVIHMNHGTSDLKACGALSNINNGDEFFFTYMLAPSKLYVPIFAKEYICPESSIKICGEPMTDELFAEHEPISFGNYKKVILWLPTFRQSSYLNYSDSSEGLLPMFSDNDYRELNQKLKELDFLLLVKLHSAQNTEALEHTHYSNIDIMDHDAFIRHGGNLYALMAQADVLLGDYSSASLQFLLTGKPLAFIVPDMDEYKKRRGFCFDRPEDYMPGPLIKKKEELYAFLSRISEGTDSYADERKRVRDAVFKYQDGNNTKRVIKLSNMYI